MGDHGSGGACPPGECEIGWDRRTNTFRCRNCYYCTQTLVDGYRHGLPGDFRVVCAGPHGSEETACPIGPSEPSNFLTTAQEDLAEHQERAHEIDDCKHAAKIIQL